MRGSYVMWILIGILCALTIPAGAVQRLVIVEAFTQWNCGPCASWNPTEHQVLTSVGRNTAIGIKVHVYWPSPDNDPMYHWNTGDASSRISYYGVSGVPDGFVDGVLEVTRSASGFRGQINQRYAIPAPCSIALTASVTNATATTVNFSGTITASDSALNNTKLFAVLISDSIHALGGLNGETDFPNVFRDLWPGASGQAVTVALGGTYDFSGTLNKDSTWDSDGLSVVVFLQDQATRWVHQGAWTEVALPYGVDMQNSDPVQYLGNANDEQVYTFLVRNRGSNADNYWVSLRGNFPASWTRSIEATGVPGNADSIQVSIPARGQTWVTAHIQPNGQRGSTMFAVNVQSPNSEAANATKSFRFMVNPQILVINDDAGPLSDVESYFVNALSGVNDKVWGIWNWQQQVLDGTTLQNADMLVWYTGNSPSNGTLNIWDQDALGQYMDNGGNVFLTGQGIAWDLRTSSFLSDYMHVACDSIALRNRNNIEGVSGDYTSENLSFSITGGDGASNQQRPCAIHPTDGMATTSWNFTGTLGHAGARVQGANYRAIFLAYGFEAINNASARTTVMRRAINWLLNVDAADNHPQAAPHDFALEPNYPNPFNPETTIPFSLPDRANVSLKVFDLLGHQVATLMQGPMNAGTYRARFNGQALASGVYFYRLEAQAGATTRSATRKLILLK